MTDTAKSITDRARDAAQEFFLDESLTLHETIVRHFADLDQSARIAELVGLVREIEWGDEGACMICDYDAPGHAPNCRLAKAIKESE